MIVCQECQKEFMDIGLHVRQAHGISSAEYLERYPGYAIVDAELVRKRTGSRDHASATAKALETFVGKYEGGHPLKDPTVRALQKYTRTAGGKPYLDLEKIRKTNLERYGVEHLSGTAERREISRNNMQRLNGLKPPPAACPDADAFKKLYLGGMSLPALSKHYGFKSDFVIKRWVKELGLPGGHRRI